MKTYTQKEVQAIVKEVKLEGVIKVTEFIENALKKGLSIELTLATARLAVEASRGTKDVDEAKERATILIEGLTKL